LVRAHLAEGNRAEAIREYERFCTMLADELGVQPTAQMRELVLLARRRPIAPHRQQGAVRSGS
jgi:DNA-binding SARP family transcriptional activator